MRECECWEPNIVSDGNGCRCSICDLPPREDDPDILRERIAALEKRIAELEARPVASAGLIEAAEITDDEVEVCFEAASIAERNGATFSGYIRAALEKFMELRSRAADRSVHGELIPDCPTEGVAARQGNGG